MVDDRNIEAFRPAFESVGSQQNQPAYVASDNSSLHVNLEIDRLCAQTPGAVAVRQSIETHLRSLRPSQLRGWLSWAHQRQWTGKLLLMFLKFWEIWRTNPLWWESSYWDYRMDCWHPVFNPGILTREAAYRLVSARVEHGTDNIIDLAWHDSWVWHPNRQIVFPSFIAYALFRATDDESYTEAIQEEDWEGDLRVPGWDEDWLWEEAQAQSDSLSHGIRSLSLAAKEMNYDG